MSKTSVEVDRTAEMPPAPPNGKSIEMVKPTPPAPVKHRKDLDELQKLGVSLLIERHDRAAREAQKALNDGLMLIVRSLGAGGKQGQLIKDEKGEFVAFEWTES